MKRKENYFKNVIPLFVFYAAELNIIIDEIIKMSMVCRFFFRLTLNKINSIMSMSGEVYNFRFRFEMNFYEGSLWYDLY